MPEAIAAGHICLDIIPDLTSMVSGQFDHVFTPGRLIQAGPATLTAGGSVSNTGLALHRLGIETRLIARVGDDQLGRALRHAISAYGGGLEKSVLNCGGSNTSYTIVISPPGSDRRFLHHPGTNDEFSAADILDTDLKGARLFHFGYPPVMARMYAQEGRELETMFRRVKACGLTTSLDMAYPDPDSPAGRADWQAILSKVLPWVDVFVPSLEEISFMLWHRTDPVPSAHLLAEISEALLGMGTKMVLLKLGDRGLYLRTAALTMLGGFGSASPQDLDAWGNFEAWLPCFKVEVIGTTGAGDVTVAGFLSALLRGLSPQDALKVALGVGASCVEAPDALSGLRSWEETWQRIHSGWSSWPEPGQSLKSNQPGL
jgi:sugar/nucleoside kinase (ribokinase family)